MYEKSIPPMGSYELYCIERKHPSKVKYEVQNIHVLCNTISTSAETKILENSIKNVTKKQKSKRQAEDELKKKKQKKNVAHTRK